MRRYSLDSDAQIRVLGITGLVFAGLAITGAILVIIDADNPTLKDIGALLIHMAIVTCGVWFAMMIYVARDMFSMG